MAYVGICLQDLRNTTSWCRKVSDFSTQIAWLASAGVYKTCFINHSVGWGTIYGGGYCRISLLDASPDFLWGFKISTSMPWQEGQVQLWQSDMELVSSMGKIAKCGYSDTAGDEMQYLIKNPHAGVVEELNGGDESPTNQKLKAAIPWHPGKIQQYHVNSCRLCENCAWRNP